MKQMRLYLYLTLGVFLALFIVGTFLDYQISSALFDDKNTFGLIVSVIGPTLGYGMIAVIGGGFFALFYRKEDYPTWMRVFFMVGVLACLGAATFFAGREFFGPNGFYWVAKKFWGYFIAFPAMVGLEYLGYLLIRKAENKDIWILLFVVLVAFVFALTAGVTVFKVTFHRPRFRTIVPTGIEYYPWYERCTSYKGLMETYNLTSEEFKSFPSGHSAYTMGVPLMAVFLPLVDQKYTKYRLPIFFGGLAFSMLVMFTRLLVGAHFLSDVSMGAIIVTVCMIIALEILRSLKKFNI